MSNDLVKFQGHVIECITVDFWNTIASDRDFVSRLEERATAAQKWFADIGHDIGMDVMRKLFDDFSEEWSYLWRETQRTAGPLDLVGHLVSELKIKLKPREVQDLKECIEKVILDLPPELVDGAVESIQKLHKTLPIALICDTGVSGPDMVDELLRRWNLFNHIDDRIYSLQVGVSKPNAVIFKAALNALGDIQPNRALHIGDLEETDVKGAKDSGMFAVRFDWKKCKEEHNKKSKADLVVESWEEFTSSLSE